jgi:hypothetical protein
VPSVYVKGDNVWTLKPGEYDMSVIFPPEQPEAERPDWLRLGGLRVPYGVGGEYCNTHYPCLIEARYADEGADSIPADRLILNVIDENSPTAKRYISVGSTTGRLYLRPAKYRITAMDRNGRAVTARDVDIGADNSARP